MGSFPIADAIHSLCKTDKLVFSGRRFLFRDFETPPLFLKLLSRRDTFAKKVQDGSGKQEIEF